MIPSVTAEAFVTCSYFYFILSHALRSHFTSVLTSGLYSQRQLLPQLLRKICLGSHSGLASWSSSGANQSQQGINSTLNLTHTEGSTLSSWPCQATTTLSRSGPRRLTSNEATPTIRHKAQARHSSILKKPI